MTEETIFTDALERSAGDERKAFLDEACHGDTALRQQVETLLKSHVEAGSFLGEPVPECLAKELELTKPTAAAAGEPRVDDDGQSLNFLTPSDKPDSLGRLGSYEVQEVIGRGGMGIVLRAFDEKLHRVVAIKVMTAPLAANATARKRFTREARSAAAVSHDHVVTIHGVEETSDLPYLVMQYVSGVSLQERLDKSGPLQLHEVLRIGMQTATGLAAAHAQGLVHRDIKPSNILLENGVERVKITDFGLAHAVDDVRTTQPGTVIGTPEYMSPEQARGEKVDHRSDLFSLGCVLYAMCAGRPPFRAESTVAIIRGVCDDTPRPLVEINPEIPQWLVDLIDKLIAKEASERFQSAAEVAELLGQYLAHVQQPAVNPQPAAITKPRSLRRQTSASARRRWSIAAAAALLLCAGLSLAESTGVTNVAATVIRIVRGDGTLVVQVDDPNIQVLIDGEELVITGAGPKEIRLRPGQHELQTVKGGKPADTKLITITRDGREVVKVAREQPAPAPQATRLVWADAATGDGSVSPDGRRFAFVDWETGDLAVRDLEMGNNRRLTNKGTWSESSAFANSPKFSADGTQLAYTWYDTEGGASLRVLAVDGGEPISLHSHKDIWPEAYGWSPDGKTILAGLDLSIKSQLQIALIGVTDRTVRILKSLDGGRRVGRISLAPNGRTIAYSRPAEPESVSRSIFLLDVESGQETRATTHAANSDVLAWTPDGRRLVFTVERQQTLDAWATQIADGKPEGAPQLVKADLGIVSPLGFTGDGKLYYGLTFAQPSAYIAALDLEKETVAATPLPGESFSVMDQLSVQGWSPDGQYLAYIAKNTQRQRNEIRVLSVKDGQTRALQPDLRDLYGFHWSPDGKSFVIRSRKQEQRRTYGIYQIDASTGNVTTILEPLVETAWADPQWSPDGRGIFCGKRTNGIFYLDVPAKSEREILAPGNSIFASRRFSVSPDGRQLAVLGIAKDTGGLILRLLPVDGGAARDLLTDDQKSRLGWVTWTPDGKFVLFTRNVPNEKVQGLWYIAVDGAKPHKLEVSGVGDSRVVNMAVHPDGKQLAVTTSAFKRHEVWAMENFLPPLKDSAAPAAAGASAANAPAAAAAREQAVPPGPSTHLVWANAVTLGGMPSPDGKHLAYVDWDSGDVGVYELATGKSRRLLNEGYPSFAESCIFSPDSRQVAFSWFNKGVYELRTIGLDGSGLRVLYSPKENERNYVKAKDWSADGKYILANLSVKNEPGRIVLVSVADGSVRVLKTQNTWWETMSLSPDGRYVAYSILLQAGSRERDIFLLATDGSGEVPLVQHPADDDVLGWTPDGKRLLFTSDRSGNMGIWMIAIADGKPHGAATLVQPEMGRFNGMGLTRSGSLYYGLHSGGQNVYTATLDPDTATLLTPPVVAIERSEGFNWSPAWSPDGKYLACLSSRRVRAPLIYVQSVESGEVRELVAPSLRGVQTNRLHWSGDGTALVCAGYTEEGRGPLKVDVQTGAVTTLARGGYNPFLSPDGKALFFQKAAGVRRLIRRHMESGNEQVVYENEPEEAGHFTLSPDGSQLAFAEHGGLKLLPATGGKSQKLLKAEKPIKVTHCTVAWTPDGRFVLFGRPNDEGAGELWRVPVTGGEAQKIDLAMPGPMQHLRVHPDGRQITFNAKAQPEKSEVWVLENFLPPLADAKPAAAANASDAKSK